MPSFAHLIIGLGISIFLYKITEGKFSTKHGLILTVNNLFGPDLASLLPTGHGFDFAGLALPALTFYYFFHGYGWFIIALPLTVIWDIGVNRTPFKKEKNRYMKTYQVYFLIVAGGLLHLFVDVIGHPSYIEYMGNDYYPWGAIWIGWGTGGEPIYMSIQDILASGMFPCGNKFGFIETTIFYSICMVMFFGVLLFYAHKSGDKMFRAFIILGLFYIIPLAIFYYIPDYYGLSGMDMYNGVAVNYFGRPDAKTHSTYILTGGEADLGVLLYFLLFFALPFIFIYYSFSNKLDKDFDKKPIAQALEEGSIHVTPIEENSEKPKKDKKAKKKKSAE